MSDQISENEHKFNEGEVVCAKVDPSLKLIIRRYVDRIYYCKILGEPMQKELVYFEREIMRPDAIIQHNLKK